MEFDIVSGGRPEKKKGNFNRKCRCGDRAECGPRQAAARVRELDDGKKGTVSLPGFCSRRQFRSHQISFGDALLMLAYEFAQEHESDRPYSRAGRDVQLAKTPLCKLLFNPDSMFLKRARNTNELL